ncbi:b121.1 [miniopterid betaherpesvirus 1]|uniref:B121.1 n=1 Tax=miniopterid betaherpesvirus 1 TaxID=3070189 RepID=I3VQB2_9BETA|nr:b121.1 [miniopterid betaherpesvirus 1]AFK83956.1 b121.1 [miniopterid betaherpesvirus 1]
MRYACPISEMCFAYLLFAVSETFAVTVTPTQPLQPIGDAGSTDIILAITLPPALLLCLVACSLHKKIAQSIRSCFVRTTLPKAVAYQFAEECDDRISFV